MITGAASTLSASLSTRPRLKRTPGARLNPPPARHHVDDQLGVLQAWRLNPHRHAVFPDTSNTPSKDNRGLRPEVRHAGSAHRRGPSQHAGLIGYITGRAGPVTSSAASLGAAGRSSEEPQRTYPVGHQRCCWCCSILIWWPLPADGLTQPPNAARARGKEVAVDHPAGLDIYARPDRQCCRRGHTPAPSRRGCRWRCRSRRRNR